MKRLLFIMLMLPCAVGSMNAPVPPAQWLALTMQQVIHQWRDPLCYALLLWFCALLVGLPAWRSLAACLGISALFWQWARLWHSAFIFQLNASQTFLPGIGLVAVGYAGWRFRMKKERHKLPPGFLTSRWLAMLTGAIFCCLAAFPAAALTGLLWRIPIPFSGYASGVEGAAASWAMVLFYGLIGGFLLLGFLGALGGAVAHQLGLPHRARVVWLNLFFAALIALSAVGLLSVLDAFIGPW